MLQVRSSTGGAGLPPLPHGASGLKGEAQSLIGTEGVLGFYRGLGSLVMRDVPFNALFYGGYETICSAMMRLQHKERKDELSPATIFTAGGLAGCLGACNRMIWREV